MLEKTVYDFLDFTLLLSGGFVIIVLFTFAIVSAFEKEIRAFIISFILALLIVYPIYVLLSFDFPANELLSWIIVLFIVSSLLFILLPLDKKRRTDIQFPVSRYDERDLVFSRRVLKERDGRYEEYYALRPDKKDFDDNLRKKSRLLSPDSQKFHPYYSTEGRRIFDIVDSITNQVDGAVNSKRTEIDPEEVSSSLKKLAIQLGAKDPVICELNEKHLYSIKGRGERYGQEIIKQHDFAIVIIVEMDRLMNKTAPEPPTTTESARQYLKSAEIVIEIARKIRELGYSAKAHIDANYELICTLVARDAGLGEFSRMGLLINKELGPRFRIAVVTTDLPLITDKSIPDPTVESFCSYCKKCARNCPVNAITDGPMNDPDGLKRWQIKQDTCFSYWCSVGTDCGRCMAVCPYSHPDNFVHKTVKYFIRKNYFFWRFAILMDDLFYGRRPDSFPVSWLKR